MGLTQKLGTIPLAILTDSSNNVGIGAAASGSYKFQVTGTTNLTAALTGTSATFTAAVTSSFGSAGANFNSNAATTGSVNAYRVSNTSGTASFGIDNSVGGDLITGGLPYATLLQSISNTALQLGTNQIARMTITNGGDVGIGTTGGINVASGWTNLTANGSTTGIIGVQIAGTNFGAIYGNLANNNFVLQAYGTSNTGNMVFLTNSNERMRISSGGNVGIGTSGPNSILEVQRDTNGDTPINFINGSGGSGNTNASISLNFILRNGSGGSSGGVILKVGKETDHIGVNVNDYFAISTTANDAMGERMRITSVGNVGIGTTTPTAIAGYKAITLSGTDGSFVDFRFNNSGYGRVFTNSVTALGMESLSTTLPLVFKTQNGSGSTERMRINPDGTMKLYNADFGTVYGFSFKGVAGGIDCFAALSVNSNGNNIINFFNQGNSFVAAISVNASTVSYGTGSDYRLKEDFKDFNGLEKVSAIKVYDFKFKEEGDRMEGVLAHELQEVIPYAVTGYKDELDKDGNPKIQNVDYSKLTPILIKAIQEQQAQIEELRQIVATK